MWARHEVNPGNIGKHGFYGNHQSHFGFKGLTADIINVALIYNMCSYYVLYIDQAFRRAKYAYCDLLSWSCSRDGLSVLRVRISFGNMTASWPHQKMIPDTWLPSYLRLSSWRLPCGPQDRPLYLPPSLWRYVCCHSFSLQLTRSPQYIVHIIWTKHIIRLVGSGPRWLG